MSKSDEIDRRRAAAYAWRFLAPDAKNPEVSDLQRLEDGLEEQTAAPNEPDSARADGTGEDADEREAEWQELREEAWDACNALADAVDRVWPLADEAAQAEAVAALLARGAELGLGLCAMQHHPLQSVRLLRLAVRHYDRLSAEARRDAHGASMWLEYDHVELFDLMAEIARTRNMDMVGMLQLVLGARTWVISRHVDAGARLARMLEQARTVHERYIVTMWLYFAAGPELIGPLRRMLRQPCFSLRYHALSLLDKWFPDAIQADDVLFLLEEAVDRVLPLVSRSMDNFEVRDGFPDLLTRAVVRIRPPGGHAPLLRLVDWDCARRAYDCNLDDIWALCTLAAAYPEHAVDCIDQLFRRVESDRRLGAVRAASRLPDELAWPRLLAAAADGIPEVAEIARETWLERRGSLCPVDELAGVEVGLLEGPPSEDMRSRLEVLRTGSLEVRAAMTEVLLGEAPDPEALVLLLFVATDDRLHYCKRPGLPSSRKEMCAVIISAFGARGVQGLCALAVRYPEGRWGWLDSLSDLVTDGYDIPEEACPVLQAAALRAVAAVSGFDLYGPLRILGRVGAPPELFDRLWSIAWAPAESDHVRMVAADALATIPRGDRDRDRVIATEMEAALAASDVPRFARAAFVGLRYGLPEAVPMVQRALAQHGAAEQDDLAVTGALDTCVGELQRLERLPDGWFEGALAQPGTQAFAVAARHSRRHGSLEVSAALRAALDGASTAAAAEAAITLMLHRAIEADDPVLVDIAERAPLRLGSMLLGLVMLYQRKVTRSMWPLIERILTSPDPDVTSSMQHTIFVLSDNELEEELLTIGPRIVEPEMRDSYDEWYAARRDEDDWQDAELEAALRERAQVHDGDGDGDDDEYDDDDDGEDHDDDNG